ncbi:unnamed protein product [Phaeothamnion confervicola]
MSSDKKKFVIKPFRPRNQMDTAAAQLIWQALSRAIDEIHNMNAGTLSFEELYRNAYNLVLHKHGELLYHGVRESVQGHLLATASIIAATTDEQLLTVLAERWDTHGVTMVMVRDILMYMDRTYVVQSKKTPIYDLGLEIFRDTISCHEQVQGRLRQLLLQNIQQERGGQLIDRALMRSTLSMLVELGINGTSVYEEHFERHFLQTTREFYQAESQDYVSRNTCPDYLRKAEARLNEEAARAHAYLNSTTEPKLKHIVETELIAKHGKVLVEMENSGCIAMFKNDKLDDLGRMYELFLRVPAMLDDLRNAMGDFVKKTGRDLVMDQEGTKEPVQFVHGLLELRDKYERIVSQSMRGEKKASKKLKEAFEHFVNVDTRVSSHLAQYIDELLKSGLRGMGEAEAEQQLEKVLVIFRYLQDKDVFENFYKIHLAKRLLNGRSVSDEAERNMIAKLKAECGYQFTSKLEGMFTDMRISKDVMEAYATKRHGGGTPRVGGIELEVNVLTTGYWPTQTVPMCRLPANVVAACEAFEKFYLESYTGRKMAWQPHMGNADVRANFGGGRRYELNVSTYQMCILVLFNGAETLTLAEIKEATQIADAELKRHLVSLTTAKHKILRKASKGKGVADDDAFTFNADFSSKLKRVRVPLVSSAGADGSGDTMGLPVAVEEGRRLLVDAAVVRIMKTRKTLGHNDLIAEVTRQLSSRFVPSPVVVKKRIEALIEREFIERDASDR